MTTYNLLTTGDIPPGCPIPYDPSRCFDCDAPIQDDLGRCFPCRLSVKLRAVAAAKAEAQRAMESCANCALAFGVQGPADSRLCNECAEVE